MAELTLAQQVLGRFFGKITDPAAVLGTPQLRERALHRIGIHSSLCSQLSYAGNSFTRFVLTGNNPNLYFLKNLSIDRTIGI